MTTYSDAVLNAHVFIEDRLSPATRAVVSRQSTPNITMNLRAIQLREALEWLQMGLRVGFFDLDTEADVRARDAMVQYIALRPSLVRAAVESSMPIYFAGESQLKHLGTTSRGWLMQYFSSLTARTQQPNPNQSARMITFRLDTTPEYFEYKLVRSIAYNDSSLIKQIDDVYFYDPTQSPSSPDPLILFGQVVEEAVGRQSAFRPLDFRRLNEMFADSDERRIDPADFEWNAPWPGNWRAEVPWQPPAGLEAIQDDRRSRHLRICADYVENSIRAGNIDLNEATVYARVLERLRGEVHDGSPIRFPS